MADRIEIETRVEASQELVWRCLTQVEDIHQWWNAEIRLDPELGGRFSEPFKTADGKQQYTTGMVVEFVPTSVLQLSIRDSGTAPAMRVRVALTAVGRRTDVALTHEGFDQFLPEEAKRRRDSYLEGWKNHVEKFKAHCEEARKAKA